MIKNTTTQTTAPTFNAITDVIDAFTITSPVHAAVKPLAAEFQKTAVSIWNTWGSDTNTLTTSLTNLYTAFDVVRQLGQNLSAVKAA